MILTIGDTAPEFCIQNQDEIEICLRDLKGKWIILYFYPKDNTPGCSTQAYDFTQAESAFDDLNAVIFGVSPDSCKKHRNFILKKDLDITLLSDEEKVVCNAYGVWQQKKMAGHEYMGVVRTTYIIDPSGIIKAVWNKVKVRTKKKINGDQIELLHVDDVKDELIILQKN